MRNVRDTFILKPEKDMKFLVKNVLEKWIYRNNYDNVVDYFRRSVYEAWNQDAIVSGDARISYKELDMLTDSLANMLIEKDVKKGDYIAIIGSRSIDAIVSMIGIIKVGAVYVPIDSNTSVSRIEYILDDCKPKYVFNLSKQNISIRFPQLSLQNVYSYPPKCLYVDINTNDVIYILYTSGTTGKPKGTLIRHKGVTNLCQWFNEVYDISSNKNMLHMTNISFDVSVEEIFASLLNKGTLFIIPENEKKLPKTFWKYLKDNRINIAQFVPATLKYLLGDLPRLPELNIIICGGERLDHKTKSIIIKKGYNLYNHYGPTEITVDAITCKATLDKDIIGKPIRNTKVYIFDVDNKQVEKGEIGELCIAGDGVAKGYLNNKELTDEKFVRNPLFPDKIIYRTGDRATYNEDNEIVFCGRLDEQIKLNGVRIEIGDIEANILEYKGVRDVAVVLKVQGQHKFICAYYTVGDKVDEKSLKAFCISRMPANMIPHYFIELKSLPLNNNEKICKKTLELLPLNTNKDTVESMNEFQKKVFRIWKSVLGVIDINMDDIFNEIGGDSLGAARLCSDIEEKFSVLLPLNLILSDNFSFSNCCKIITSRKETLKSYSNILLLNRDKTSDRNLFFVHGGNGEPGRFIAISSLIRGYNCWGFRANVLDGLAPTNTMISDVASNYIMQLKQIQPYGPYNIIGWCIGGSIAYEMTLQLESQGDVVSNLALVNTFAPDVHFWGEVKEFDNSTEFMEIKRFLDKPSDKIYEETSLASMWSKAVIQMKKEYQEINMFKKLVYDDMDRAIPNFHSSNYDIDEIVYYINVMRVFDNARALYNPKGKVHATCTFYKATFEMVANAEKWQEYFEQPIKYVEVEGDNFSIWGEEKVICFAKSIQETLCNKGGESW